MWDVCKPTSKMLTVCHWIFESEVKEESQVWDINFGVICVYMMVLKIRN